MNAELEGYQDQLLAIRQDAPGVLGRLSDQEANWRPAADRWSIAECFGHLSLSAKTFLPTFDTAIDQGRMAGRIGPGPFSYSLLERMLVHSMEPPPRIRVRARASLTPVHDAKVADVLREFMEWQDRFAERLHRADGLDLKRVRARSPVAPWLKYSLGTAFRVFLAHERRHLWQARQVRQMLDERSATPAQR